MCAGYPTCFEQRTMGVSTPWSIKDLSPWLLRNWQSARIVEHLTFSTILYRRYLVHTFCAVCSGHKLVRLLFDGKQVCLCNLLRMKRKLVAGGKNLSLCLLYGCNHQNIFRAFPIHCRSFQFFTGCVLLVLDTIWPHGPGVNPSVETVCNWHTCSQ